jgi:hypothetical protein
MATSLGWEVGEVVPESAVVEVADPVVWEAVRSSVPAGAIPLHSMTSRTHPPSLDPENVTVPDCGGAFGK